MFWSVNAPELLKKAHKNSIRFSWLSLKMRLKVSDLKKKVSKLVFLVNIGNASQSLIGNAPTFL